MPDPDRQIAERVQNCKRKPRFFAFEEIAREEISQNKHAERGKHREKPKPEGTHSEYDRTERHKTCSEGIIHGIAGENASLQIRAALFHFVRGHQRIHFFFGKTVERRLCQVGHALQIDERFRVLFGIVRALTVVRRCRNDLRRQNAKFARRFSRARNIAERPV